MPCSPQHVAICVTLGHVHLPQILLVICMIACGCVPTRAETNQRSILIGQAGRTIVCIYSPSSPKQLSVPMELMCGPDSLKCVCHSGQICNLRRFCTCFFFCPWCGRYPLLGLCVKHIRAEPCLLVVGPVAFRAPVVHGECVVLVAYGSSCYFWLEGGQCGSIHKSNLVT